jgi:thymidylate synthase
MAVNNSSPQTYISHLDEIMSLGSNEQARGLSFKEIVGKQYTVPMHNPIPNVAGRKLGLRFAIAEPFWILSGGNLLADIASYGRMEPYSDDGYFMSGAYGPKIIDQLGYVCKTLTEDRGSRQAVINIWRERPGPSKDIPCTLSLQFIIRKGYVNCIATMRSSDAIMGLPYDSILFSLTSAYVISIMKHHYGVDDLKLGRLTLTMGSAHIYDKDFDLAKEIVKLHDWDSEEEKGINFNRIAQHPPVLFLDLLESYMLDEDSSGILEL